MKRYTVFWAAASLKDKVSYLTKQVNAHHRELDSRAEAVALQAKLREHLASGKPYLHRRIVSVSPITENKEAA